MSKPVFENAVRIAQGIAETFGSNCEVVVHDFSNLEYSIVSIFNGHVTGRTVETKMTEPILEVINKHKEGHDVYNYTGKSTMGRMLKSTTIFLRESDRIVGCICINFDITDLIATGTLIQELSKVNEKEVAAIGEINKINDVLYETVEASIGRYHRPVIYLTKDEKVEIVKELELRGVFLIKGAVEYVAASLNVSRYTIYNYLDSIRENK